MYASPLSRAQAPHLRADSAVVAGDARCKPERTVRIEIAVELDTAASIGVMVVDDQPAFRRAARAVINATAGFQPVADAASALEALRNADQERADLVLMDVYMPEVDGFEATRRLTAAHPETVVVLVSLEDVEDLADEVAACGAVAFLHKRDLRPATLRALWATYGGDPKRSAGLAG